jgi:hypothetical protein
MILVKKLKTISEYWDEENREFIFERDGFQFALKKNEFFPTQRAFTRVQQTLYHKRNAQIERHS